MKRKSCKRGSGISSGCRRQPRTSAAEEGNGCLSQLIYQIFLPHKGNLTSKLNSKTVPVLPSLEPFFIFPFRLLPSPVYHTGFSFFFFPWLSCHFYLVVIEQQQPGLRILIYIHVYIYQWRRKTPKYQAGTP